MRKTLLSAILLILVACGSSGESDNGGSGGIDLDAILNDLGGNDVSVDDAGDDADDTADADADDGSGEADTTDDTVTDADTTDDADDVDGTDTEDTDVMDDPMADADVMDGSGMSDVAQDTVLEIDVPPTADLEVYIDPEGVTPFFAFADVGDLVRWRNRDTVAHAYRSADGTVDTGILTPGQTYELVVEAAGTFVYESEGARFPDGHLVVRSETLVGDHEITIEVVDGSLEWTPRMLEIEPGDTVVWNNTDTGRSHSVLSDSDLFSSGELTAGLRYAFTFNEVGDFTYRDEITLGNTGIISVLGPPPVTDHLVSITGTGYDPSTLTVAVGETVMFRNDDDADHSATALGGEFDSGRLLPGEYYVWTAGGEATIRFSDSVSSDPAYNGRMTVEAAP